MVFAREQCFFHKIGPKTAKNLENFLSTDSKKHLLHIVSTGNDAAAVSGAGESIDESRLLQRRLGSSPSHFF